MTNYCVNHPDKQALSFCHACKRHFCSECLVEGSDYYYCKNAECQVLNIKEIESQKQEIGKAKTIYKYGDFANLWSLCKEKEKFQGLAAVIIINAVIFLLLGILVLRYYMINTMGVGSVVISNNFSGTNLWQLLWGIGLIGIALVVIIIASIRLVKKKRKTEPERIINYFIGCVGFDEIRNNW